MTSGLRLRTRLAIAMALLVGGAVALTGWATLTRVEAAYSAEFDARVGALLDSASIRYASLGERARRHVEDLVRALLAGDVPEDRDLVERLLIRPDPESPAVLGAAGRLRGLSGLDLLEILDSDGRILSSAHWFERVGFDDDGALDLPEDRAVLRRERLPDGEILAVVSRKTLSLGSRSVFLVGGVELGPALLDDLAPGAGEAALLFDATGGQPRSAGAAHRLGGAAAAYPPELLGIEGDRARGDITPAAGGPAWAAGSLALRDPASVQLGTLVVAVDPAELISLIVRLRWTFLTVGLAGGVLAAAAGALVARRVTRPLEDLVRGVESITAGQVDYTFPQAGTDEVGELVQSFSRMHRSLEIQQRRALAAERVAAWREVAQRVAHEVKNPLSPIRLAVENMIKARRRAPDMFDPVFDEATAGILEEVDQLERIVTEFSEFARMPAPQPRPTDLDALVDQVLSLHAVDPRLRVRRAREGGLEAVTLDPEQVSRALKNLVGNAVDAMQPDGGELEVSTKRDGDTAFVEVCDRGTGLSSAARQRLFEPYFTTKEKGTGLGLPIALRIISDHGGSIRAENRPEGGVRIVVQLPVSGPEPEARRGE